MHRHLNNLLKELYFKCSRCELEFQYENMVKHKMNKCVSDEFPCILGCGKKIKKFSIQDHILSCDLMKSICNECEVEVKNKD